MFIRKLDLVSPRITLYYKGEKTHSSLFGGLLTIIVNVICLIFGVFYFIKFFNKLNPQVYYYNRFVEDAGEFPLNSSSMFSFVQILDTEKNIPDAVDFDMLNIIGIELAIDLYQDDNDLTKYNHWFYGPCNSKDTEGIKELITFDHFTESACIRKYYNKEDKKYYNTDDPNFKWPRILHGCGNPNRTFYGIIVEKCRNTTLKLLRDGKFCKPQNDIINYIKKRSIWLKLIDHYIDMFNFTSPFIKYFYSISNGLYEESYTTNHLNFNPSKLISDEGNFFEQKKEILSYLFDLNEKITSSSLDSGIYVAYYFWMQRRMQYYERVYSKIQDTLSNIGGFFSTFLTVAEIINYIVNQYIILFDISHYINEIDNSIKHNKKELKLNLDNKTDIDISNNSNKLFPPKKTNFYNSGTFEKGVNIIKGNSPKVIIRRNKVNNKSTYINNSSLNKNKLLVDSNNTNDSYINKKPTRKNVLFSIFDKNIKKEKEDSSNSANNLKENKNRYIINNKKEKNIIGVNESKKVNNEKSNYDKLKFCQYLFYLISLNKNNSNIQLYVNFRNKMISEENLIMCNLNIDKLMKNN